MIVWENSLIPKSSSSINYLDLISSINRVIIAIRYFSSAFIDADLYEEEFPLDTLYLQQPGRTCISATSAVLSKIFAGWDGYQTSILHAIQTLTQEQLTWRPAPELRSVGELASHIALGRLGWFARLQASGSLELYQQAIDMGWEPAISSQKDEILKWLEMTWQVIADSLNQWTVEDLWRTFEQEYQGVIWSILAHDLHHGGELAVMLGMQGIEIPELGDLGGHLAVPALVKH